MANSFSRGRIKVLPIPRGELHKLLNELVEDLDAGDVIELTIVASDDDEDLVFIIMGSALN